MNEWKEAPFLSFLRKLQEQVEQLIHRIYLHEFQF